MVSLNTPLRFVQFAYDHVESKRFKDQLFSILPCLGFSPAGTAAGLEPFGFAFLGQGIVGTVAAPPKLAARNFERPFVGCVGWVKELADGKVLEVEYTNARPHTAFMTGQIQCEEGGAGELLVELFDEAGKKRFDLATGAHQHADSRIACNTVTMPIPPVWSVKCYRIETKSGISTRWAEID